MTHLLLVGASHHTAPVELRERLDFVKGGMAQALEAMATLPVVAEAAVVSTCNRAELYVACEHVDPARAALVDFMSRYHELEPPLIEPHLYTHADADAARHLFRVAAGLDSLVVGEPQILGQVKEAFSVASAQRTTGVLLNKLFHHSFAVGKRVRHETALAEGAVSVSYAAVSLARKIFGDLRPLHVLLLGAGEMGKLTAIHLRAQQVSRLTIASRTTAHAESLVARIGGTAIAWSDMQQALRDSDIVITATGASTPILSRAAVQAAVNARRQRPLFIIDIAVPRDVEPSAGEIEQIFLYNIDDLRAIVRDNLAKRAAEIARAEAIVSEEVGQYAAWLRSRGAIPTVVALRQRFEAIRRAELQRLEPKLAGLPPEARDRIDDITRLIVEKLLLTPTEQLKTVSDEETVLAYADALSRLFSLREPAGDEQRAEADEGSKTTVRS